MVTKKQHKLLAVLLTVIMLASQLFLTPAPALAINNLQPGEVRTDKTATPVPDMVNTWDIKVRVEGKADTRVVTTDIVLIIDRSGSMADSGRMANAITAAKAFVNKMLTADPDNTQIAVTSFSSDYDGSSTFPPSDLFTINQPFSDSISILEEEIGKLVASGGTHTQAAIINSRALLTGSTADKKFMVLLSDGQPTFSYEPQNWTLSGTEYHGKYDGTYNTGKVVGTGNALTQRYNDGTPSNPIWRNIHNGDAAIKAATDAKPGIDGIFTIAVSAGTAGTSTLNSIASPGMAYTTSDPSTLTNIYNQIGTHIQTLYAMRNGQIVDEMGDGFRLVPGHPITVTQGTTTVTPPTGTNNETITWDLGSFVSGETDEYGVHYAEMTYRVEVTDGILTAPVATPGATSDHDLFETNKSTVLTYKNINDQISSASITSPQVDPVLLKMKKILTDALGNEVTSDPRTFNVRVKKPGTKGFEETKSLVVGADYIWLTSLRHEGTYTVTETGVSAGTLNDFDIEYEIDGSAIQTFLVSHDSNGIPRGDITVKVKNRENVARVSFGGTKTLTGRTGTSVQDVFTFTLTAKDGGKMPASSNKQLTFNGNGTQSFDFGQVKYVIGDLGGALTKEFNYEIKEVVPSPGIQGMDYDPSPVRNVKVTLTKNPATGAISVSVDPQTVHFTNHYRTTAAGVTLGGSKELTGGRTLANGDFQFRLFASDSIGSQGTQIETVSNVGGNFTFSTMTYSSPGTYYYLVKEVIGSLGGVTYDQSSFLVEVVVTDNGLGNLLVSKTYKKATGSGGWSNVGGIGFINSYQTTDTQVTLTGSKSLTGVRPLANGDFQFELYESDSNGTEVALIETVSNVGGNFTFQTIPYASPGTHYYLVKEVIGSLGGVTYDQSNFLVEVVVADNGSGALVATVSYKKAAAAGASWTQTDKIGFTNSYQAAGTQVTLAGSKSLNGRTLANAEFQFELYDSDSNGAEVTLRQTVANSGGSFSFTPINYTAAGDYYYLIKEVAGSLGGVTYDQSRYLIKVEVTDDGLGALSKEVIYKIATTGGGWATVEAIGFTNSYQTTDTQVILDGSKTMIGRTLVDQEFEFKLYESTIAGAEGNWLQTAENFSGGFAFVPIGYTETGTHYYLIKEVEGSLGGVTYDLNHFLVKVEVTDNGLGSLVATKSYQVTDPEGDGWITAGNVGFINRYLAANILVTLTGSKSLTGRTLEDDEFEFTLYKSDADGGQGNEIDTVSNDGNSFTFETMTFDEEGTYYFLVKEANDGLGGVVYDDHRFLVTVVVTDDGSGALAASVTYQRALATGDDWAGAQGIVFANSYGAEEVEVDLGGWKDLEGRTLVDGEFSFTLFHSDPAGTKGAEIETVTNLAGQFDFTPLVFDEAGTYYFLVKEVDGGLGGVTYDGRSYRVIVTITDDLEGQLVANVTILDLDTETEEWLETESMNFFNSYLAREVRIELGGSKGLEGRTLVDGEFEFALHESDEDGNEGTEIETVTNSGSGFLFGPIDYYEPGVYYYLIKEMDGGLGGVTYDDRIFKVAVTVTDDLEGQLVISVGIQVLVPEAEGWADETSMTFTNFYEAEEVEIELGGWKDLEGRTLEDEEFAFRLFESDDEGVEGDEIETVRNLGDNYDFTPLVYGQPGVHYYLIKEVDEGLGGVTYDDRYYWIQVTITDNLEGNLVAEIHILTNGLEEGWVETESLLFANFYEAEDGQGIISGTKALSGRPLREGEFTFELYLADGEGQVATDATPLATTTNLGSAWSFTLDFTAEETGTYYYLVKERAGSLAGVSYDSSSFLYRLEVEDDLEGQIQVEVIAPEDTEFNNRYTSRDGSGTISGTKALEGRPLVDSEFTFELYLADAGGRVAPGASPIMTTTNTGNVWSFTLTFGSGDDGTHYYVVREKAGSLAGVIYDNADFFYQVAVGDGGRGAYEVSVTHPSQTEFKNRYVAEGSYQPQGVKNTVNGPLLADAFEFELIDSEGHVIQRVKNLADGRIPFASLIFGLEDVGRTFVYTIREVEGSQEDIIYDDRVITLTLTVSDEGDGHLKVTRATGEAPIAFTNLYELVAGDEDEVPVTGEGQSLYTTMGLLMMGLALMAIIMILAKRRKKEVNH